MTKPRSEKQLANDQRLREMAAERKKTVEVKSDSEEHIAPDQDYNDLKRQLKETQDMMKAFMAGRQSATDTAPQTDRRGEMISEFEKYSLDPKNYPDPTERLAKEPRLKAVNFDFNYELDYKIDRSRYQTSTGRWMVEPKFYVQLNRVVVDDQGNKTDKRYIARRLLFHEDPDAALVIAHENGLDIDKDDQKAFLNEMRYLRVRDWLFDIFWPKPATAKEGIKEEVIGGTIVQVFTKSSEDPSSIDFDKLNTKVV